jgi:ATP-binding cassette subfamily B multidrug efflux pump
MSADSYHVADEVQSRAFNWDLMRRLLLLLLPYKKLMGVSIILLIIASCLSNASPLLMMHAVDKYINAPASDDPAQKAEIISGLLNMTLLLSLIIFLEAIIRSVQLIIVTWVGQRTMFEMRMDLFRHLQELPLSFLDRNPVGRLMSRVTSDVDKIQQSIVMGVVQGLSGMLTIIAVLIFMFYVNWQLAAIALLPLPFIFLTSWVFRKFASKSFLEIRRKIAGISAFMQETMGGIHLVQILDRQRAVFADYDRKNADHRDEWLMQVRNFAIYFPAIEFFSGLSTALILLYVGNQVLGLGSEVTGIASFGTLVGYVYWTERLYVPIRGLADRYNTLLEALASSERVFELMDTRPEIVDPPVPVAPEKLRGEVQFDRVWFSYGVGAGSVLAESEHPDAEAEDGSRWVLRDVNFTIAPGERVAVVGHTGAGKTTLINMLGRFYDPQRGVVRIDGVDVRDYAQNAMRQHIGIVLQNVFLFNDSVENNIRLGDASLSLDWVRECAEKVHAAPFIGRLPGGYDYRVGERGANLSSGQRQLIAFARTLAHQPEILVLDEATSNIDTETEALIQDAMLTLMQGRTSLVIAHRLSTIRNADRILVMHHGEVRESGSHDELLRQGGLYKTLYELQFSGLDS